MSTMTVQATTSGAFRRAVRSITRWAHGLALYLDRRAALKQLQQLDDRALRDIGLSRCDIDRELGRPARPDVTQFL
jgi:uncharacterized protein YjiS (DUF1127 family)